MHVGFEQECRWMGLLVVEVPRTGSMGWSFCSESHFRPF